MKEGDLQLESLSGPMVFGGLGRLRMTSLASCDLLTMASLSLTAVCMRLTFEEFLPLADGTDRELPTALEASESIFEKKSK